MPTVYGRRPIPPLGAAYSSIVDRCREFDIPVDMVTERVPVPVPLYSRDAEPNSQPVHYTETRAMSTAAYDRHIADQRATISERTVERASLWAQEALRETVNRGENIFEAPSWGSPYSEPISIRRRISIESEPKGVHSKGVSNMSILFSKEKKICQDL